MSITQGGVSGRSLVLICGVGVCGGIIGGAAVYVLVKRDLQLRLSIFKKQLDQLRIQAQQLTVDIQELRRNSHERNANVEKEHNSKSHKVIKSALKDPKRTVRFSTGYDTADDEEYVTASSEESDEVSGTSGARNVIFEKVNVKAYPEGDDNAQLFERIDGLLAGDPQLQAQGYELLKSKQDSLKNSSEYWWRLSKATHLMGAAAGNAGDLEAKKKYAYQAFHYSQSALELNENCSNVHKWYAITLGSKNPFVSTNEKIQNGYVFKDHIDRAIKISPKDATLHHLLGRFCYEVSQLSWLERKAASALFSAPPTSSYDEALTHFLTAENTGEPFKDNRLFISKCFIGLGDYENGASWLKKANDMPTITASDEGAQKEILALYSKYSSYLR